jgi:hypothetical protein
VRGLNPARTPYVGPKRQFGGLHTGGAWVAMADGSLRKVSESVDPKVFEALSTMAGGERARDQRGVHMRHRRRPSLARRVSMKRQLRLSWLRLSRRERRFQGLVVLSFFGRLLCCGAPGRLDHDDVVFFEQGSLAFAQEGDRGIVLGQVCVRFGHGTRILLDGIQEADGGDLALFPLGALRPEPLFGRAAHAICGRVALVTAIDQEKTSSQRVRRLVDDLLQERTRAQQLVLGCPCIGKRSTAALWQWSSAGSICEKLEDIFRIGGRYGDF